MKALSWPKYVELAARTESIPTIQMGNHSTYNEVLTRLLHAQLGLQTELTEYTEADSTKNKIEELGDTQWYLAIIHNVLKPPSLNELIQLNSDYDNEIAKFQGYRHWLGEMADVLKRCIYYGEALFEANKKGIVPSFRFSLAYWGIIRWIEDQTMQEDIPSVGELCALNIEKLSKRYPDLAFKPSDALIRDVEKELNHIPEEYVELKSEEEQTVLRLTDIMYELQEEAGVNITEEEGIFVGCSPVVVRDLLIGRILQVDEEEFKKLMGYALDNFVTTVWEDGKGGKFIKLTEKELLTIESIAAEPPSESIEMLDFPTFRRTMLESFVNFTDMLVFGGNFFSALDNYYSENGCLAMSKAYKTGYRELLAYRPSQAVEAVKDIWGVLAEWGPKHRLGIPRTKAELIYMMKHQKELCLCQYMLKK